MKKFNPNLEHCRMIKTIMRRGDIKQNSKILYTAMSDDFPFYYHERGYYAPSHARLAESCKMTKLTIINTLKDLEQAGLIKQVRTIANQATRFLVHEAEEGQYEFFAPKYYKSLPAEVFKTTTATVTTSEVSTPSPKPVKPTQSDTEPTKTIINNTITTTVTDTPLTAPVTAPTAPESNISTSVQIHPQKPVVPNTETFGIHVESDCDFRQAQPRQRYYDDNGYSSQTIRRQERKSTFAPFTGQKVVGKVTGYESERREASPF